MTLAVIHRIWPIGLALLTFFGFELVASRPKAALFVLPVLFLLSFLAVCLLLGPHLKTPSSRWKFWLMPAIFYFSSFAMFFLIEEIWLRRVLAAVSAALIGLFLESIHTYIWEHEWYEIYSLENIAGYLNVLSAFLFSAALLGFMTFLQLPLWAAAPFVFLVYFVLTWEVLWLAKVQWSDSRPFALAIGAIFFEIFIIFSSLPAHFLVEGAVIGVLWYTFVSAARAFLLGFWNKRLAWRYVAMAIIFIGALLVTAKWI
ncbi:MAG: hypothetical protein Q8M83_06245 [bacterium]|nr:hypothetical protein [bacterium]